MMNHPFPANLPLLRKIYKDRFSEVRFLIPFERMPDEDVITVYRGSYIHAAYLTDAWEKLAALECDYYLVVHDDVLLNPKLAESTFFDVFDLGPDDGFISEIGEIHAEPGRWVWNYGFVPKFLFPKSLLFGSGIETANLKKYLPSFSTIHEAFKRNGATFTLGTRLDSTKMEDVQRMPSRVLLHGLSGPAGEGAPGQPEVEATSLAVEKGLLDAMLGAARVSGDLGTSHLESAPQGSEDMVPFPFPVASAGYFTDFYILPRSGLDDFCHYMGVAGAANLFVEILAPTLLHACCAEVKTAAKLGLDFSAFHHRRPPSWFDDPKAVAMHPFKLSVLREPAAQERFMETLNASAAGVPGAAFWDHEPGSAIVSQRGGGWHVAEPWGFWSADHHADVYVEMQAPGTVSVKLRAPTHPDLPPLSGALSFDNRGGEAPPQTVRFEVQWPQSEIEIQLHDVEPSTDGKARIVVTSDTLVDPTALGLGDARRLGFGLVGLERLRAA